MPVNHNNQFEKSIIQKMDLGLLLIMAVEAREEAKTDGVGSVKNADDYLSSKIKAGCIQGRYATKDILLTTEQKASILDYIMEYHIDWDFIAQEILKNFE